MTEALSALTQPLDVPLSGQQAAEFFGEEQTPLPRLLVVHRIDEDDRGATLHFQQGGHGRLVVSDANYESHLRWARTSQERKHPVGLSFGEGLIVTELLRADNDIPAELWEEGSDCFRVLFLGHDGLYSLKPDHPELARIRAVLDEAILKQARIWFIAQRPDLVLLDVAAAGWAVAIPHTNKGASTEFKISFVVAPDHLFKIAEQILGSKIRCTEATRRDIRAVAKAYIDEADELKRGVHEIQTNASIAQIQSLSPPEMIEKAKRLRSIRLSNQSLQGKVRKVAESYVLIAEKNQQHFEEFKKKYRDLLPEAFSDDRAS